MQNYKIKLWRTDMFKMGDKLAIKKRRILN